MPINDELIPVLKKLRLSGVLQTLDLRTTEPEMVRRLVSYAAERYFVQRVYEEGEVDVEIYDVQGRRPRRTSVSSGQQVWGLETVSGEPVANGLYLALHAKGGPPGQLGFLLLGVLCGLIAVGFGWFRLFEKEGSK